MARIINFNNTWRLGIGLTLALGGCTDSTAGTSNGQNDGSTTDDDMTTAAMTTATTGADSETGMAESSGDPPLDCLGAGIGAAAVDEACTANEECASGVCTVYSDVPVNADAVCASTPADCATRATGTVFDFITGEPVAGAEVVVAAALQAATNPTEATALMSGTSGADGRLDVVSDGPIMAPLGIVALSSGAGYQLTATGIAAPGEDMQSYAVGSNIHDLWVVPSSTLSDWSDALGDDAEIPAENLPLGETGGVVGLVRDSAGNPIAGATVVSMMGDASGAFVRYLGDDGTFGVDSTSDAGMFVIINPGLGENFDVMSGGASVGGGTAGSAAGAIFTLIVNAD